MNNERFPQARTIDRRTLIKMSVCGGGTLAAGLLNTAGAMSQENCLVTHPTDLRTESSSGWKNDANRASGNGPMDETTRQIVEYVNSFSESDLTPSLVEALNYVMLDYIACLIAGFESEPARICARLARQNRSDLKSTVLGYGVTTTPELATFANTCMHRYNDFDINYHISDIIPGILAIGEALHVSGSRVLVAVTLAYEIASAFDRAGADTEGWDNPYFAPATAVVVGKLMGLNEDQLANALSLALVPHMPMSVSHVGALSMWKGCHDAEAVRCGVFAALLSREGMTGPCQPFEARAGLWDHVGPFKSLRLPIPSPDARLAVEKTIPKRYPADGWTQSVLEIMPAVRAWTKADDVASMHLEVAFPGWQENADPAKWDPRNRETADHSLPYVMARALLDGEIYLDSYEPEKLMDPLARQIMEKITVAPNPAFTSHGQVRLTVRSKSGSKLVKAMDVDVSTPMKHEEVVAKYNQICTYRHVIDEQRDRIRAEWLNLKSFEDIAEPLRTVANFGEPLPL